MLRIFFCASAAGGATSPTTPSTETSTTNTNKQSLIGRAMDFSSFAERTRGARDGRPGDKGEEFEGLRAERDSSTVTPVESVQDGSEKAGRADHATRPCLKNGRYDIRTPNLLQAVTGPLKRVQMRGGARRRYASRTSSTVSVPPRAPTKQMGPFQRPASRGIGKSNSGAYCWAPKTSRSPGLPLGRSRRIVNLIANAGSNSTNAVICSRGTP